MLDFEEMKAMMEESEKKRQAYFAMTNAQLAELPEEELFDVLIQKVDAKLNDESQELSSAESVFYVASEYEAEVNNGGLCQYFANSSGRAAPILGSCLAQIGALEHKAHFEKFVQENGIDITDLSQFEVEDAEDFLENNERYPFDSFDDAFYEMKPICEYLVEYFKANIDKF